ncbi:hypothetical protein SARC_02697 [Sphaeroforma arctica JP610]|uniref:Uncharacterized protein n=1 Tax=Sphaeroforma arctica JP610 TaxID=667725 RepID=A0A0L0G7W0_9EUKA|nr:hypothetical protein SARC_02697 [Sphaeroforma arctica JP610]KNC85107.1 hypothetical protein SARC_02697 [Sphaeroforma arctica JP610]|eukprot:XP_014159009.1 hypothetical protein SARC_02697 [Sphaeroforma arctica JP610]
MGHSSGPSSPDTPRHTTVAKRRLSQDTDKWGMKTGCSQSVAVTMNDTQRSVRETLFCYVLVNVTDLTVYMPRSVVEGIPSERVQQTLGRSLLAYFRLLAVLYPPAPSANVVRCVRENIDQFGELFWLVDAQLAETDYSKLEGLAWWLTVMCEETTGDALVAKFLGQTVASRGHPSTQLMCDFFISLNGTATQISFNERLLSVFYRLVRLLCCYSIDFIRVWMGNNNFTWAVENLMTANVVYSKAMTEVLLVVEYTATRNTQRHTQQREEAIANCARLPPALKTAVWVAPIDREQQGLTERRANLIQKLVNNHTLGDLAPVGGFVVYTCLNTKQPDPKPLYALFLQVYIGNKGRGLDVLWARLISLLTASTAMQDKLAANASQPQAHALPPPGYAEGAESRRTSRKGHDNAHGRSVRSGVRRGDVGVQTGGSSASIDIDEDDLDDFLPPGQSKSSPAHNASHSPTQARVDHVVTPEDMEREATLQCILRVFARVCEWVQQDLVPRNPPRNQDEFTIISITRSKLQSADAENVHVTMEMALLQRYLMFEPVCVLACGCGRDDGGCSTSATTQTATADTATLPHPTTEPATSAPHTNTPATTTTTTGTGTSTDAPPRPCRQDISRAAGLQLLVTVCDLVPPTLHDVRTHLLRDHLRIGPRSSLPTNRNARAYKMSPAGGRHTIGSYLGHTLTECTGPGYARMSVCGDLDPPRTTHTPTQLRQLKEYCGMVNQIVLLTLRPPIEFDSEDDDTDGEESVVLEGLQLNMAVAMTTTSVLEYSPHRIWPTSWSSSATPVARSQLCEHVRMESNRQAWEKYILFVLKGGDGYLVNMPVDVLDRFAALVDVVLHTASVPTKTAIATYIESVVSDMLADERSPKATLLQIYKVLCVCINTNALDKQLDVASSVSVLGAANPSTSTTNPELLLVKNIAEKLAARS